MKIVSAVVAVFAVSSCLFDIQAANRGTALSRVRSDVEFFASDEQEGRGVATRGIERSAERIIDEFEHLGLKPVMPDGSWRQTFRVEVAATGVGPQTRALFQHRDGTQSDLQAGRDFQALLRGSAGRVTGGIVFVGFGMFAPEQNYDDYADIDVTGKTVIFVRRVPRKGDPAGPFFVDGDASPHEYITTKLNLAVQHGAAAAILVNDFTSAPNPDSDRLTSPGEFGEDNAGIPFLHVRQSVVDQLLARSPVRASDGRELKSLREVTREIDVRLVPLSAELTGCRAEIVTQFVRDGVNASNILGMVPGEGPLAHETIVVGGHYDHIGYGDFGSRAGRERRGEIHNGADDNASGAAAVLELARRVANGPPPRRSIIFACFSGEERGLLGSKHYVDHSPSPIQDTVAMLNFDMIGTLRNRSLEINGVGTAAEFLPLVTQADEQSPIDVRVVSTPFNGGSDHLPFYRKQVPVMFCFTGETDRYHTPDDDVDAINMEGLVDVIDLAENLLTGIDQLQQRPGFRRTARGRIEIGVLGIRPDLSRNDGAPGVTVLSVVPDSAAEKASLQVGDVIIQMDNSPISGYASLYDFLRGTSAGQMVQVTIMRGNIQSRIAVTLGSVSR